VGKKKRLGLGGVRPRLPAEGGAAPAFLLSAVAAWKSRGVGGGGRGGVLRVEPADPAPFTAEMF